MDGNCGVPRHRWGSRDDLQALKKEWGVIEGPQRGTEGA